MDSDELGYPQEPDKKGYARRYYKRRAYYFGRHNTAESFILFGEWKKELLKTGEAPEVSVIREKIEVPGEEEQQPVVEVGSGSLRSHLFTALCTAVFSFIFTQSFFAFRSTPTTAKVDDKELSGGEQAMIRGLRVHDKKLKLSREERDRVDYIANRASMLLQKSKDDKNDQTRNSNL